MKEYLLRVKELLERKCFAIDDVSIYQVESFLDVIKAIDNEGAFKHIEDYINASSEYYAREGIEYDEAQLYPRFSLYFDARYYDNNERVDPIPDIVRIYVNALSYEINGVRVTIDPDDINIYQEYIISFEEFKTMLEESGLTIEYASVDDILKDYRNNKPTVCKISKRKNGNIRKYGGEKYE